MSYPSKVTPSLALAIARAFVEFDAGEKLAVSGNLYETCLSTNSPATCQHSLR